jgi:hypothetical protein
MLLFYNTGLYIRWSSGIGGGIGAKEKYDIICLMGLVFFF